MTDRIIFVILVFLTGCSAIQDLSKPCIIGWHNSTHYCNEFHNIVKESPLFETDGFKCISWSKDGFCTMSERKGSYITKEDYIRINKTRLI